MFLGRVLGSLLIALALTFVPTTAFAQTYSSGGGQVEASDSNPEPGETVSVTVECEDSASARIRVSPQGGAPGDAVYIDGTQTTTSTLKSCVDGEAGFGVRIEAEGRYAVRGLNARGQVLGVAMLVVGDGVRGENASRGGDRSGGVVAGTAGGGLGSTGASPLTTALGIGGASLVLAGAGVLMARRRGSITA